MFFPESEAIAHDHPDLLRVSEQVDARLATIFSASPLRPADFASAIRADVNQVESVFRLLAMAEVLSTEEMMECEECHTLLSLNAFQRAKANEDKIECTSCGHCFPDCSENISVYRMTGELLDRPRPQPCILPFENEAEDPGLSKNVFQRRGEMWVLAFDGITKYMREHRGLFYISRILDDPRRQIPAISLLAAATGIDPKITSGSSGPLIDEESRVNYEQRCNELWEDLQEAEQCNDLGRIEQIQAQLDIVSREIVRATGLGGRKREKTDADRIRNSVSMAVARAIDKIESEHSSLAHHLTASITSGYLFKYDPEKSIDWLI